MAGIRSKNPSLPRYVSKTVTGAYKYQRRVPKDLIGAVGKGVWDYSLGSDPTAAYDRASVYRAEHDTLLARLRDTGGREAHEARRRSTEAAPAAQLTLAAASAIDIGIDVNAPVWRQTEARMESAQKLPPSREREMLALFAGYAFGDHSYIKRWSIDDPFGLALATHLKPLRPEGVQGAIWDALKSALDSRLAQIVPADDDQNEMRLIELMDKYTARNARPATARSYKSKARALADAFGNHPLEYYTHDILRRHRDGLATRDVKPATILAHFNILNTLWTWAAKEYREELAGLTFPRPNLDRPDSSVEDDRWRAFDDDQIKTVWHAVSESWSDTAKSRLTQSRRRAFLMALRVMLWTGMRPSEVFRLTADSVKGDVLSIQYTKTKSRQIPLSKHIADLPGFLRDGGFAAELGDGKPESLAGTMRDQFRSIIHAAGVKHPKLVLYSLKDTLIDRLQRLGVTDDTMRGIIGHTTGQGKLRHYKTPFGQSAHGMQTMREALDAVTYWPEKL